MKHLVKNIKAKPYNFYFTIAVSDDYPKLFKKIGIWDDFIKELGGGTKKSAIKILDQYNAGFLMLGKSIILFVRGGSKPHIIAHECFHALCEIMRYSDVILGPDSEEAFAYSLEDLIRRVIKIQKNFNTRKTSDL